jgi:hypothetical protein
LCFAFPSWSLRKEDMENINDRFMIYIDEEIRGIAPEGAML